MPDIMLSKVVDQFNKNHKFDIVRVFLGRSTEMYQEVEFNFAFELNKYQRVLCVATFDLEMMNQEIASVALLTRLENAYHNLILELKKLEGVV